MGLLNALALYRVRLRARWAQECLAAVGIAAGVALLFASQIASASLQSSVSELARGIAGEATLQVLARGERGMPESVLARVRAIHGVRVAAPVLEASANAIGPRGSASLRLIGADASLSQLGGTLVRSAALRPFAGIGAVVLPVSLARAIGVHVFGQEVRFQLDARTAELPLYARLSEREVGPLADSAVALMPLASAQESTGLRGRLSRILVAPAANAQARVRAALERLASRLPAARALNVEAIDYEEGLFAKAAAASSQSSALFAAVSALVGFLFAWCAMLLTVPQRRRLVLDMRREGYGPLAAVGVLMLDAVLLGLTACALGLLMGWELSLHALRSDPAFLSIAFAVGSQHVVSWQSVAFATGGGMFAALAAVLGPLRVVLARGPHVALERRAHIGSVVDRARGPGWLALAGAACAAAATLILLAAPDAAIPGMVLLVAALLLVLPLALAVTLALVRRTAHTTVAVFPHLAAMELSGAGARAVAIAATGAIAMFGSVAIQGAHGDLLRGLDRAARDMNASVAVWVAPAGPYDLMHTASFAPADLHLLERIPGVASVRVDRGGLLDYGQRRVLVIAPSSQSAPLLPEDQIVQGDAHLATARVRGGGWLVLSRAIAAEHHLRVGQALTLPSPAPTSMRIAALSTNLGWAPGTVIMNATDYARAWGSQDASAYAIQLVAGGAPAQAARAIARVLGPGTGLAVQTAQARTAAQQALSRQALARLTQIATLIPLIAVLAMAAAIAATIWQRRPRLARLKLDGLPRTDLWLTILFESGLLVGVGCLAGALFGLYGQQLADRALARTIDFPVVPSVTVPTAIGSLVLMSATALAILTIPGYLATAVPPTLALVDR